MSSRIPRRTEPDLSQFKTRPRGDEGNYIAIPEAGRAYFSGTTIPAIGAKYIKRPDGLIVPEDVARRPQPLDLIRTYVTFSDIVGVPPDPDYLVEALGSVGRYAFIQSCAQLLGLYEKLGASRRDIGVQLADLWFKEPAKGKILALVRDRSTLVAPQTLLLLMQSALARSPHEPEPDASPQPFPALILAVQEGLGFNGDDNESNVFTGDPHSALFRQVVAGHHFGSTEDEATTIAHHQQRWVRLDKVRNSSSVAEISDRAWSTTSRGMLNDSRADARIGNASCVSQCAQIARATAAKSSLSTPVASRNAAYRPTAPGSRAWAL